MNRDLITLCGADAIDNYGQYEIPAKNVIQAIPKLVPYGQQGNVLKIYSHDGLLEFSDQLPFLNDDYQSLLKQHYDFLEDVKTIRNKYEHKMHGVKLVRSESSKYTVSFELTYSTKDKNIELRATQFISFAKDLNSLFSKIQKQVGHYAYKNRDSINRAYFDRLTRYDFGNFNRIYDSDVLGIVGMFLFPF